MHEEVNISSSFEWRSRVRDVARMYICQFKSDANEDESKVGVKVTVKASEFEKTKRGEFVAPKRGCHDATERIQNCVDITDVKAGLLNVLIKHTSASLTVNDARRAEELEKGLNELIPESWNDSFLEHTMEGPDDCPAHIKATILGETMNVPIRDGNWRYRRMNKFYSANIET